MASKEEIFDWAIDEEDNLLKLLRFKLKEKAYQKFGQDGIDVVEKYYRQIDGEEDFEIDEECDDCKEKARKLIQVMDILKVCNDNLTSDKISAYFVDVDLMEFLKNMDDSAYCFIEDKIKSKTCLKIDSESKKDITVRIFMEAIKRIKGYDYKT